VTLADGELLELMKLSTQVTLHYESVLAKEEGADRPYGLSPAELHKGLARMNELLGKGGRRVTLPYSIFAFVDESLIRTLLAETLTLVCGKYDLEQMLHNQVAGADESPPEEK
jgi:hypothetical protein